jgi:hypothetical protein
MTSNRQRQPVAQTRLFIGVNSPGPIDHQTKQLNERAAKMEAAKPARTAKTAPGILNPTNSGTHAKALTCLMISLLKHQTVALYNDRENGSPKVTGLLLGTNGTPQDAIVKMTTGR